MKKTIIIPGFKGGLADSLFDPLEKQTFQMAKDLDIFSFSNILRPHIKLANDAGCTTTNSLCNIVKSGTVYYAIGNNGSNALRLFSASALAATTSWATVGSSATANTAPNVSGANWMEVFDSNVYFWDASGVLSQYVPGGSYTQSWASSLGGRGPLLAHPGVKKLLIAAANKVYIYTSGAAPSVATLTLDAGYIIRSMAPMGNFTLIAAEHSSTTSKIFVWDNSAATVEDVIDVQDVNIKAVRNVNGEVIIFTANEIDSRAIALRIYKWAGNKVTLVKEFAINATADLGESPFLLDTAIDVLRGGVYFALSGKTVNSIGIENLIYCYKEGIISQARLNSAPVTADVKYWCVRAIDGDIVTTYQDVTPTYFKMDHPQASASIGILSANGIYQSNAFFLDPYRKGIIKTIKFHHYPLPASTGFRVTVRHFGDYDSQGTPTTPETFAALISAGTTTSFTTDNSTQSILAQNFKRAQAAQIQIEFNTISTVNALQLIFPIIIEAEIQDSI